MKWYWLTASEPRTDVFLLHREGPERRALLVLPRFADLRRCSTCEKWDEERVREIGFDQDRILNVKTDFHDTPNDLPLLLVSERVKLVFHDHGIDGVDYIPCGKTKTGQPLFVLWPVHQSHCLAPPAEWTRTRPYPEWEDECCSRCGRTVNTIGHPYYFQMEFPDPLTISVPDIRTENRLGVTFKFLCSGQVRQLIREAKLTGTNLSDLRNAERWFPPT